MIEKAMIDSRWGKTRHLIREVQLGISIRADWAVDENKSKIEIVRASWLPEAKLETTLQNDIGTI